MVSYRAAILAAALAGLAGPVQAASITSDYAGDYLLIDLGSASTAAHNYGGLVFKAGASDTLLLAAAANSASGVIDAVAVIRGVGGHITGFGDVSHFADAPFIDGGLAYAPDGTLLYTAYPSNQIGQIKPGSTAPDKIVSAPAGSSVGALQFVPAGFSGAGNLVISQYASGKECVVGLTADGGGTYDVGGCSASTVTGNGPEGFIYVPAGGALPPSTMLMTEYGVRAVSAYLVDGDGLPIASTRQVFISDSEAFEGATIDPITGDFLFATFGGGSHIYRVQAVNRVTIDDVTPVPEPASLLLLGSALTGFGMYRRRRR